MTEEKLRERLRYIYKMTDPSDYPEVNGLLSYEGNNDFEYLRGNALQYAGSLSECDGTKAMSDSVAEFVEDVLQERIDDGDAEAACRLGSYYYDGRIGDQNFTKAVELYTLASRMGSRQATENLGYCYYYGRNIPVDYEKAYFCFVQGALDGHPISMYKIGDMYKNGYFVEKDEVEAFHIYKEAEKKLKDRRVKEICGADVYLRLADCYYKGTGTEKNLKLAFKLFQRAERMFYDRLLEGDFMIRNNYLKCIRRQEEIRAILQQSIPKWKGFDETAVTENEN